ncbi:hypothetical protein [Candidatus Parabeggiatoa sp. HSG14]|uniref:hypothetical protein n=1 Tax=Candidatus Parabeggiatoa sp. HSG14 TaxID=3055593 RepID=UPI0025A8F2CE|nr:hypothetical protein [Thiotrichales bacterium HSG14]
MEKTIEQATMPTQVLHFSVDIEMPIQTQFNQQSIQKAIMLLLQKYHQAFSENSPEKILHNLGFKNETTQLDTPTQSDTSSPNEWEQMLQRLKQPPMTLEERKKFDSARQEFRENFIMRDIID